MWFFIFGIFVSLWMIVGGVFNLNERDYIVEEADVFVFSFFCSFLTYCVTRLVLT